MGRVGEAPFDPIGNTVWLNFWACMSALTTVGWSGGTPSSHVARGALALMTLIWGFVLAGGLAAMVLNLKLPRAEKRVVEFCLAEEYKRMVAVSAARCVQLWWRSRQLGPKGRDRARKKGLDIWRVA